MRIRFSPLYLLLAAILLLLSKGALALGSLFALLLHEGAHALVARRYGYKLDTVTLQPYGAQLDGELCGLLPREEIYIALAGPLASALTALLSGAVSAILPVTSFVTAPFAISNAALAAVNLLPVYPMDGGRMLYAALCDKILPSKALRIVSAVGLGVGAIAAVGFCVGLFFGVSFTLASMAVFMIASAIGGLRGSAYAALGTVAGRRGGKTTPARMTAVPSSSTLLDALKLLSSRFYNVIVVLDESGSIVGTADEGRLTAWSLNFSPDTTLKEILSRKLLNTP